jgi:hypothetical protein
MSNRIEEEYGEIMRNRTPKEKVAQMKYATEAEIMELHGMSLAEYGVQLEEYYENDRQRERAITRRWNRNAARTMKNPATSERAKQVKNTLELLQRDNWTVPFEPSAAALARQEKT